MEANKQETNVQDKEWLEWELLLRRTNEQNMLSPWYRFLKGGTNKNNNYDSIIMMTPTEKKTIRLIYSHAWLDWVAIFG